MREPATTKLKGKEGQPTVAVIYARVSSKEQEKEGFSIPAQLRLLREYAATTGLKVLKEFVDVETAKESGRSGFGAMAAFLRGSSTCRTVLVEKTDRLYRNLKDWVVLDEIDLDIHFVKENAVLSRDSRSSEKFMHGIKVLMAKNYIDNLSEETRKGMREKAEQGLWPSCAPLGYRNADGPDGKRVIEPDPALAPVVTRLFERFASGRYSLREVTRLARAEGMVFRKSREPITHGTAHRVLRNRIYTGSFDWDGRPYAGKHAPLVSEELWRKVQGTLDDRLAGRRRRTKHDFAFSGLVSCGHCGCSLTAEVKKGQYIYYHCTGFKGRCPEPYVREEVLTGRFGDLLGRLEFDAEVLKWAAQALRQSHQDEKRYHDEAVERLQREYVRFQNRIDAMYVDKLDGKVSAEFFERKAAEWRADQGRILGTIEGHQDANQNYLEEGIQLLELAREARSLFLAQSPGEKRKLLGIVVSNSTWKDGRLQATFRKPFDLLAVTPKSQEAEKAAGSSSDGLSGNWLPIFISNLQEMAGSWRNCPYIPNLADSSARWLVPRSSPEGR